MEDPNKNYNPYLNRGSRPLDFRDPTYGFVIAAVLAVAGLVGILYFNHHAKLALQNAATPPQAQVVTPVTQP